MKRMVIVGICMILFMAFIITVFINENKKQESVEAYLRVHIRANSNSSEDQQVKYVVKAAVVDFLTPKIAEGSSFKEAYNIIESNLNQIEKISDKVLKKNGYDYKTEASLNDEYFPTRSYGEYTLERGYYDALIVNLGDGKGDNWWCVVYPPLCFIGSEGNSFKNIKYKSKLVEIIKKFFN